MDMLDQGLDSAASHDKGQDTEEAVEIHEGEETSADEQTAVAIATVQQAAFSDHNIQYQFRTENNGGQVTYRVVQVTDGQLDGQGDGAGAVSVVSTAAFSGTQQAVAQAVIQNPFSNGGSPSAETVSGETRFAYFPASSVGDTTAVSVQTTDQSLAQAGGEKLKLLHALCGKLLTLVTTRDFIEDYMEELRQTKQEFRELKAEQNKREREEAATRIRKRREEKLKEQELRMKDKQEKLKEDENSFDKSAGNEELDDLDTSSETKDAEQKDQDTASEDESTSLNKIGKEAKIHIGIQDMKKKNQPSEGSTEKKEPLTANEETFRKEQQKREQELLLKIQEATACTNIFPLGRDRWYRRYWSFYSVPGLFVEEDYSGLTEDMLQPQPISQRDSSINSALNCNESSTSSVQENKEELEIRKPVNKPNRWCYFSASEQVDKLIEALNTRGHRESSLKEVLLQEKNKICQKLSNISSNRFSISDDVPPQDVKPVRGKSQISPDPVKASAEKQLELRLCDLLLDIEERIYQGTLGAIKVLDRQSWRTALEKCCYEFLFDETKENGAMKHVNQGIEEMDIDSVQKQNIKERLHGLKTDVSASSTNTNTPQSVTNTVHYLARALHQIEQGVERKYLKYPLGDADDCKRDPKSEKKKKEDRKKKDEDQSTERDDVSDSGRVQRTVLDRWRESLLSSGSLSQIFLHLSTLDRSIMWSRSIRNARCKVCRKKGDGENMLLCDGCDRGHHIYCVRPKLKFVPEGDWFCPECKPKQRSQRQLPKQRPSKDYEDEELEAEELEEEQEQGDTEEETVMSEEESVLKKGRTKVKLPLKTKGGKKSGKTGHKKGEGKTPKNQQSTPKNILTALKSGATTTGRKTQSAPSMGNKSMSHLSNFNSPSSHETSLVELVSHQVKGRGRGKALKSLDNTPESSPFAFRPFSLNIFEMAPLGRRSQPQTSQHDPGDSKGKSKKRVSADISSVEQGSRRSSGRHYGVHEISACEQLVVELVRHDDSWPFMKVVSKLQVPDYFDIIKKPIALNVIREKVNNCEYKSASEFIEDIELMFSNCFEYNHINSNEAKASYAEFIEDIELMFSNCFEYNHINSNEAKAGFRLQSFFICEAKKLGLEVSTSKNIVPPLSKKSRL